MDTIQTSSIIGIAFKGPEGIVLAADSRVTLNAEIQEAGEKLVIPSTFDNATKLLRFQGHDYVGAVTYGAGAIGTKEPRTAHSFLPEFENELRKTGADRFPIKEFSEKLSDFFSRQWAKQMAGAPPTVNMVFLIGGYDAEAPYGRVYRIVIPTEPAPKEQNVDQFGLTWGGQLAFTSRLIKGMDPLLPALVQEHLKLGDEQREKLASFLESKLSLRIPYQFLPLQDCVDLAIHLISTTIDIQTWQVGVRGVGGAIDVATITRTDGFSYVQRKAICGRENS
jgi:hypothetical protein